MKEALLIRLGAIWQGLFLAILLGLALVVPGLVIPNFSRIFIDDILVGGSHEWLYPLLIAMFLTAVVRGFLVLMQRMILLRVETGHALISSLKFLEKLLYLPINFYAKNHAGEVADRVRLNDRVAKLLSAELVVSGINCLMLFCYGLAMFLYNWELALVGYLALFLNLSVLIVTGRRRASLARDYQQSQAELAAVVMSSAQLMENIRATASENEIFECWADKQAKTANALGRMSLWGFRLAPLPEMLAMCSYIVVMGLGALQVMDGDISMGGLVAFQLLLAAFLGPAVDLIAFGNSVQTVSVHLSRLDEILEQEDDHALVRDAEEDIRSSLKRTAGIVKLSGRLDLKNVDFGYTEDAPPLISGFNLSIDPGMRVALVGPTGSGKTTIAKIVCGLVEPWSGDVLLDSMALSTIPRALLTSSRAWVDQDFFLFSGSVRNNIAPSPEIPGECIIRAAKDAQIHEVIVSRVGGYDSIVAEGGGNFSGGQRQRLEIARALASDPSLLIMDEATSALDPAVEMQIDMNLRRRGCTCLIVAQRLSTIRDCDLIVVLDHGRIVEQGTHADLVDSQGIYFDMISCWQEEKA
ncbi:MAG: ABC transporter transmembrane domain-containing protein [Desulfovibrio sp.]